MDKFLWDNGCIDKSRLLLLRAKELKISDLEAHLLMIILTLNDVGVKLITPMLLKEYSSLDNHTLDKILDSLFKKNLILKQKGNIIINHLDDLLLKSIKPKINHESIITQIEVEFGRSLSPFELETLQEWKRDNFDDETISKALKEAVKSQAINFRYIESILHNWKKHGITSRYIEEDIKPESNRKVSHYKWWQDE